jgi:hypothetical protein
MTSTDADVGMERCNNNNNNNKKEGFGSFVSFSLERVEELTGSSVFRSVSYDDDALSDLRACLANCEINLNHTRG